MKRNTGFTLMEMMVVVVLIAIVAAFAIPNYRKSIRKARERDAMAQLMALHAANLIYKAQTNEYYQSASADLNTLNSALGINIISNGMTYSYASTSPGEYIATAEWPQGDEAFTVMVSQDPIVTNVSSDAENSGLNPCCYNSSNCPSLPQCT